MPAILFVSAAASVPTASKTLTFVASATVNAENITLPSSIEAGDIIVLFDKPMGGTVTPTLVIPTGFTSISDTTDSVAPSTAGYYGRITVSYKKANGSEAGSSITGMLGDSTNPARKMALVFRPNFTIATLTPASVHAEISHGNPSSQTVTSGSGAAPLIVFGFYGQSIDAISPRTFSPAEDAEISVPASTNVTFVKYKIYNGADTPANHSVDMDDEGDLNLLQSFYLQAA